MSNKSEGQGVELHGRGRLVEQQRDKTRCALITPDIYKIIKKRDVELKKQEFDGLARAIDLEIVLSQVVQVKEIKPATFVGAGFVDNLAKTIKQEEVEVVLFNVALSPVQQKNLENRLGAKVLDRTALILEIFGERAVTKEGVLQVELAHLNYQKGRLVRSWTHLERQRGGGGFIGGPGETQIESDKRQIQDRIGKLEKRIAKIAQTRTLHRKKRDAVPYPVVALVGYTNAGKSTLFNQITAAKVMTKDLLFATLDTTVRKAKLPHGREIMLSDTVGFISDLPTDLIAAFRATLEEVVGADIILHVRDISAKDSFSQAQDVISVLDELGVNGNEIPIIEVWNKIDNLPEVGKGAINNISSVGATYSHVALSALTGEGIDRLLSEIEACLALGSKTYQLMIGFENGEEMAWLYEHSEVIKRQEIKTGSKLTIRVQPRFLSLVRSKFGRRLKKI